jgi:co-chaperonin GroES (HSP10)
MTINFIIVEIDEAYNNEEDGIVVNSTVESVKHINREATVLEAPEFTILKKGDKVICHHNIFRIRNGIKGQKVKSNYNLEDNVYFIPLTEVFMFKREQGWEAIRPYVFVEPIPYTDKNIDNVTIVRNKNNSHKGNKKLRGIVKYPNDDLIKSGVKVGDEVVFSSHSQYEFNVEGETLYKMSTRDILAII